MLKHNRFSQLFVFWGGIACYFFSARLGLLLATINTNASPVWPAAGMAISLLFLAGPQAAFAIAAGAFLANWLTPIPWYSVALIALGNTVEALVAYFLFRRTIQLLSKKSALPVNIIVYLTISLVPTVFSATIGSSALLIAGILGWPELWHNWLTWWIGDTLGIIFVFPLVFETYLWLQENKFSSIFTRLHLRHLYFFILSALAVAGSNYLVFSVDGGQPFLFILFFPLLLTTYILPFFCVYLAAIFTTFFSVMMTNLQQGPFLSRGTNDSLIHLEFFLASLWLTVLVLSYLKKKGSLRRPSIAFVIGWMLTGALFFSFFNSEVNSSDLYFKTKVYEATAAINDTMDDYIRLLESGAGYIHATHQVDPQSWHEFTEGLRLVDRYSGLMGFGIISKVNLADFHEFEKKQKKFYPTFKIHAVKGDTLPPSIGKTHFIISCVEPLNTNQEALGLDISSEAYRLEAALQSEKSGKATLTKSLKLVQSKGTSIGYLLILPFYANEGSENSRHSEGFVYAPIEADTFFNSALKPFKKEITLSSFNTSDSRQSLKGEQMTTVVSLAGTSINLNWAPTQRTLFQSTLAASLAGFCGAFFSLVLAILISGIDGIREEAENIARIKTQEVQEKERIWKTLNENSPTGIFLIDQKMDLTYINARVTEMTGIKNKDFKKELFEAIHPEDRTATYQSWNTFVENCQTEYNYTCRLQVKDSLRVVSVRAVPMKDDSQNVIGYIGTVQDMTDFYQSQAALTTAARMSSIGQMASGIAHEINNPLAIISGKAEVLKKLFDASNADNDPIFKHLEKIQSTVHRIAKIIKGLRAISREPSLESPIIFPIIEVLEDAKDLSEERFQHRNVSLNFEIKIDKTVYVSGHKEQLAQVLLNLINNAYDAVQSLTDKWVSVRCYLNEEIILISVVDAGTGIPSKIGNQLFTPFFTTKQVGEGMGLGLSISKGIIERHQGDFFYDEKAEHTTFTIKLKRAYKT